MEMQHVFRSLTDNSVVDLVPYMKEKLAERNDISVYIGTDSQNYGSKTIYACVVVLHYGRNGGHVLYSKMKVERIKDRFSKLWKEVEFSLEVARHLEENGIHATYIDIDLNPDPRYGSNNVLRTAMGLVESMGFTPRCKPDSVAASYTADMLCR